MDNNKRNTSLIIGVAAVIAIVIGALVLASMNNDDDAANQTTQTQQTTDSVADEQMAPKDIVDTAVATEPLSTLVAAVKAAELVDTLKSTGPFTVFAPTNAAFEALPAGTLDSLLLPENKEQLASLLKYHVVSGSVKSTDLTNGQVVTTVNGANLTVEISGEMVYLVDAKGGRAQVTTADVQASNGVVHVIDAVLMP